MDVFLSYSREDTALAQRLAHAIEAAGYTVWWDRQISVGATFDDAIQHALSDARVFVTLLTARSVKSQWVQYELGAAMQKQRENPEFRILPVVAEDLSLEELPMRIRQFQGLSLSDIDTDKGRLQLARALAQ